MTFAASPRPQPPTPGTLDSGLRRAITLTSALIFATGYGWLACLHHASQDVVKFRWHWTALLWIAIGVASSWYFWRQIWPAQNPAPAGSRWRLARGWAVLLLPSLRWMAYPLEFVSHRQFLDIIVGLSVAAAVLAGGGWMVTRLIKAFAEEEANLARANPADPAAARPNPSEPPATE